MSDEKGFIVNVVNRAAQVLSEDRQSRTVLQRTLRSDDVNAPGVAMAMGRCGLWGIVWSEGSGCRGVSAALAKTIGSGIAVYGHQPSDDKLRLTVGAVAKLNGVREAEFDDFMSRMSREDLSGALRLIAQKPWSVFGRTGHPQALDWADFAQTMRYWNFNKQDTFVKWLKDYYMTSTRVEDSE